MELKLPSDYNTICCRLHHQSSDGHDPPECSVARFRWHPWRWPQIFAEQKMSFAGFGFST
jgi:hypothetical protein